MARRRSITLSRIRGVLRVFPGVSFLPAGEPFPGHLTAFLTQLLHEVATTVKLGRKPQFVRGPLFHLDRAHGHMLVAFAKVLVPVGPIVDLQNKIQLLVQRQVAHQFVLAILDVRIGFWQLRPLLRIDAHDPQFVGHIFSIRDELAHWRILGVKAVPVIAAIDMLGLTENGQRA